MKLATHFNLSLGHECVELKLCSPICSDFKSVHSIILHYFTRHQRNLQLLQFVKNCEFGKNLFILQRMCGSFWDETALVKHVIPIYVTVGVNKKCSATYNTQFSLEKCLPRILNWSGNPLFNSALQL